ncbi:TPA: hypothetical protein UM524_000931 [Stenotrophomonas maltophilia]|uniref:HEPN domain-containing protein n=1 Tax=Stenotrophomonas TaxID=40323 RepID=UPI000C25B72A|nr:MULTISPECIES: HEPN domain-containing protein [Stenotrophomonas]PJL45149.1 hypothetical protein B9Y56_01120 [Stenotrophomonas maltophilia]HEL4266185.1 hypothetical protein [Stenotrophomonas maltophilia]
MDSTALKEVHRQIRDAQPDSTRVRLHRAISWLNRAEQEDEDTDARFLFLWIALNAAYAKEFGFENAEREQLRRFFDALLRHDKQGSLQDILFKQFPGPIRTLIGNRFVYARFWKALREHDSSDQWAERFAKDQRSALQAVVERRTEVVLSIVLDRLYVLRNQLVHGGATWDSHANREQLRDGAAILGQLVPAILHLMMRDDAPDLGEVAYPMIPI